MASVQGPAIIPVEDLGCDEESLDDDEVEVEVEVEEEVHDGLVVADDVVFDSPSTSFTGASSAVTVAVYGTGVSTGKSMTSTSATATTVVTNSSDLKRHSRSAVVLDFQGEQKPFDDSRKLFQKLWTDEDEIELLKGFFDYRTLRGTTQPNPNDIALFHDQIKSKFQANFNKNQLGEKLRRLKRKYRNVLRRITSGKEVTFKSPHDQVTFQISSKIWRNAGRVNLDDNALDDKDPNPVTPPHIIDARTEEIVGSGLKKMVGMTPKWRKRSWSRSGIDETMASTQNPNEDINGGSSANNITNFSRLIEEKLRNCLTPAVKELYKSIEGPCWTGGISRLAMNPIPIAYGGVAINFKNRGEVVDERWRKQQILELEVFSKRLELVQDQIKSTLEELRFKGG